MPGYLIARVRVTDAAQHAKYIERAPGVIATFGGRYLVRGGAKETVEGPEEKDRVVVVEFPSSDRARAFFESAEYQAVRPLREGAATVQLLIVDGIAPTG